MIRSLVPLLFLFPLLSHSAEWKQAAWDVMGTRAQVEYLGVDDHDPVPALKAELERINRLLSPWVEDSELARVNREAADAPVTISSEFFQLLEEAARFHELSDGAFDITFASAGHLYDYRKGKAPDAATLEEATRRIDQNDLELLPGHRVRFATPGMRIDLGGIAKGYAIDRCIALLKESGIEHAWMSLGGDSYVLGDRDGRAWQVGVRHPRSREDVALSLPVADVAVSTSGDYERYFIRDGERVHHIIDPGSGKSADELASVTVIADRGLDADALSTSLFVMGIERGLALANRLENVSAVMIGLDGRVHYSADLSPGDSAD